jgi:hypothetical protein
MFIYKNNTKDKKTKFFFFIFFFFFFFFFFCVYNMKQHGGHVKSVCPITLMLVTNRQAYMKLCMETKHTHTNSV